VVEDGALAAVELRRVDLVFEEEIPDRDGVRGLVARGAEDVEGVQFVVVLGGNWW